MQIKVRSFKVPIVPVRPLCLHFRLPFVQQPFAGIKKDTKDMLSKLNIPEKPKKPTTPFLKYVNDQRNVIMREHPDYRVSDVAKRCSETWKTISSNQKSMYEQQYKKELQEYAKIQVEYESKLSQDQKTALEIAEREKQEQRKRRKLKKVGLVFYYIILS